MLRSSSVYKPKQSKTALNKSLVNFDVRGQQGMGFFPLENIIMD